MRFLLAAICLSLSVSLPALEAEKAPATMDSVRQGWTLLTFSDATQARRWFKTATRSEEPVTAYYGWEGIADSNAALGLDPNDVMRDYIKAREHAEDEVLDKDILRRLDERLAIYQKTFVEQAGPDGAWQGPAGRRALQKIAEGLGGAEPPLRLAAWETLGDRAFTGKRPSQHAAEAAYHAWSMALNQDPDKVTRVRLERKLGEAEAVLPGRAKKRTDNFDQAGVVVDPAVLALLGRCAQCGGKGGAQRRVCAEVAQAYSELYGPGAKRPQVAKVKGTVKSLAKKLTDAGCF